MSNENEQRERVMAWAHMMRDEPRRFTQVHLPSYTDSPSYSRKRQNWKLRESYCNALTRRSTSAFCSALTPRGRLPLSASCWSDEL